MATNRILCPNLVLLLLLLLYIWVFAWPFSFCCGLVPGEFMLQELFPVFDTQSMSYPSLPCHHLHPCISPVFTFVNSQNRYNCNAGTISHTRHYRKPTPELPSGLFNWIIPFLKIPDTYVLNNGSLDAYFFLRYLKVLRNISLVGCCIVWPILLPVHGTGGNSLTQLDLLTIGNVVSGSTRLWAHAIVAWLFFGKG